MYIPVSNHPNHFHLAEKIFTGLAGKQYLCQICIKGQYFGQQQNGFGHGMVKYQIHQENTLLYREDLTLNLNGERNVSYQEYLYRYIPESRQLRVFFIDRGEKKLIAHRLFHLIHLTGNESTIQGHGQHLCGEDMYDTHYVFIFSDTGEINQLSIEHSVKGPQKDYIRQSKINCTSCFE